MPDRPTIAELPSYALWMRSGGGTDTFDGQRYHDLLIKHGLLKRLEQRRRARSSCCRTGKDT